MPTKKAAVLPVEEADFTETQSGYSDLDDEQEDSGEEQEDSGEEQEDSGEEQEDSESERLTGSELLEFYDRQKAEGRSHIQIAFSAGYKTVTKNGQERVMASRFNEALLRAQGVDVGSNATGQGRSSAGLTRARVSGQGMLLVSPLATNYIGAIPGSIFSVEYPTGDLKGPGAQILVTLTDEHKPVVTRKRGNATGEQPGTPLLSQAA